MIELRNELGSSTLKLWRLALLYALSVIALVLYLLHYWFAIADRYFVFLYYHNMGPRYPDTSPFSAVTSSRYWMAGLVASGAVMVIYVVTNWLLGRLLKNYWPPDWWRVWGLSGLPLAIGIPAITMTVNAPTLPFWNAVQVTLVTLIGLALALMPGKMAAKRPGMFILLAVDGIGLMFILLYLPALEDLPRWLAGGRMVYVWMFGVGLVMGLGLLLLITGLHVWWRTSVPKAPAVFVAGLCVAYLLMPLVHHVSFTDGYDYISGKDNFFARSSALLQIVTWLVAGGIALGVTRLREYLAAWLASKETKFIHFSKA
ncbi:hypothetical protein ACFLXQ_00295 [Chloroflexota bacterium]